MELDGLLLYFLEIGPRDDIENGNVGRTSLTRFGMGIWKLEGAEKETLGGLVFFFFGKAISGVDDDGIRGTTIPRLP